MLFFPIALPSNFVALARFRFLYKHILECKVGDSTQMALVSVRLHAGLESPAASLFLLS